MKNLKRSWKVMEFEEPKRVRTLRQCFFFFFFFKEENSPSFCMLQKNKTGLASSCGFVHFGSRGLSGCVTEIHECDGLGKRRKLRATRRNNSQLCRASDVGSCSVRVGSGVQTDATTRNIVGPTMLGVVAFVLAVVSKRTQQLPTTYNRVANGRNM